MSKSKRISTLVQTTKLACDIIAPIVCEIYLSAHQLVELKADNSAFTIADGLVQSMLVDHLFKRGEGFKGIVGEEDLSEVNLHEKPYTVSKLLVPQNLFQKIDNAKLEFAKLATSMQNDDYGDTTIFIDPIDGTREFSTKLGEQCTILVGFSKEGHPVGGVVYRPISSPTTWAMGCKTEGLFIQNLDDAHEQEKTCTSKANPHGLLTTNGSISPFIESLLNEMKTKLPVENLADGQNSSLRVCAGGVGNKLMNMLEAKGACYIQDRGVSRWDTCAAQAVIEAKGGILAKLNVFIKSKKIESYKYEKTDTNLDFDTSVAPVNVTKYNRNPNSNSSSNYAEKPQDIKPYANVQGLLALDQNSILRLDEYHELLLSAMQKAPPSYD